MDRLRVFGNITDNNNRNTDIIVLGIPKGGVITADTVAKKLSTADFDILIPRKLPAPRNEELAIGATMEDGSTYLII
jgi:putative phosphoribosyl transferase